MWDSMIVNYAVEKKYSMEESLGSDSLELEGLDMDDSDDMEPDWD
jgi:hypothetical protein